jgi:hypothetical protein
MLHSIGFVHDDPRGRFQLSFGAAPPQEFAERPAMAITLVFAITANRKIGDMGQSSKRVEQSAGVRLRHF